MSARQPFGTTPKGEPVEVVTLVNGGAMARVISWGASLQDYRIANVPHALVLGAPDFPPYLEEMRHFGAIVGPVANRIAGGRAPLGSAQQGAGQLRLERNEDGINTLHGGSAGSGRRNWRILAHGADSCTLTTTLPDGASGLPGPVTLTVRYALEDDGALTLEIEGSTEQLSLCNPAHHSYWNLSGTPTIAQHQLTIAADRYLPVDAEKIPTGEIADVTNTGFDFRIGAAVLTPPGGLDHNFCLAPGPQRLRPVCWLETEDLLLELATTAPGLQVYDGAGLNAGLGHHPFEYGPHAGVALEPQHWPDAPNHQGFPSILLRPGETFRQTSRFHVQQKRPG